MRGSITDRSVVEPLLRDRDVRAIVHFAAESHVDRSIHGPEDFIETNVVGTFRLLEAARSFWTTLPGRQREAFRFVHVSTDEVYGALTADEPPFTETSRYQPNSPYSASKAASDHLARSYHHTYGLPVITTNCSNNYGPHQFPEKLIPLVITAALVGRPPGRDLRKKHPQNGRVVSGQRAVGRGGDQWRLSHLARDAVCGVR